MIDVLYPAGWLHYLLGGLWIGAGLGLLFVLTGRTGVSAVAWTSGSHSSSPLTDLSWRLAFAIGLVLGAAIWWRLAGPKFSIATGLPWWQLLAGGFLVGFGARMSGRGRVAPGLGNLASPRTAALAVPIFLGTAFVVARLTWWAWGR